MDHCTFGYTYPCIVPVASGYPSDTFLSQQLTELNPTPMQSVRGSVVKVTASSLKELVLSWWCSDWMVSKQFPEGTSSILVVLWLDGYEQVVSSQFPEGTSSILVVLWLDG